MFYFSGNGSISDKITVLPDHYGPFGDDTTNAELKKLINEASHLSMMFNLREYIVPSSEAQGTCYEEAIIQRYNFEKRGVIEVNLSGHRTLCDAISDPFDIPDTDDDTENDDEHKRIVIKH